ncbi:hypothetical protein FRC01_010926, partial [Tulasnella sp. 417]
DTWPQISMSKVTQDRQYEDWFVYYEQERISQLLERGVVVGEGEYYHMWNHLLREWFTLLRGWKVLQESQLEVSPSFEVEVLFDASGASVQDGDFNRVVGSKPVLVVVVRDALKWTDAGRENILSEVETAMTEALSESQVSVVWGIAALGFRWIAFKKEGLARTERLFDWRSDVLSLDSWRAMRDLADTMKQSV